MGFSFHSIEKRSRLSHISQTLLCQTAIIKAQMLSFREMAVISLCMCVYFRDDFVRMHTVYVYMVIACWRLCVFVSVCLVQIWICYVYLACRLYQCSPAVQLHILNLLHLPASGHVVQRVSAWFSTTERSSCQSGLLNSVACLSDFSVPTQPVTQLTRQVHPQLLKVCCGAVQTCWCLG